MRIDTYLTENNYFETRTKAQKAIEEGRVIINGKTVKKTSFLIEEEQTIEIEIIASETDIYVSRGGMKLDKAIKYFNICVDGKVCVDIGASTGGFTDCLLKHGAKFVYAVDSGSNQLHTSLKNNVNVKSMENTNARYINLSMFENREIGVVVTDVSFVSQTLFHKPAYDILSKNGVFISLVKPQFEAGKGNIGKNGIVKSEKVRLECIEKVKESALQNGFDFIGCCESPIKGGSGNIEYLCCFIKK